MRRGPLGPIIVAVRTNLKTAAKEAVSLREVGTQASDRSAAVTVAVCGDPVVGRALALVLQPARYEARFVPVIASGEPEPLGDAQVVVLVPTPGLNVRQRAALVGAVREREPSIPVLELVACWRRTEPGCRTVPWPCSTEELQQRIEDALCAAAGDGGERQEEEGS
jgi:hypothetical protein